MSGLRIARDLVLPVDAVTQSMAILARRGAGKTYTGSVIVEEAIGAKVPTVVLDPTGAWWGLRSSVDGERPGLPVVIFGGDHGDVPLEPTAGAVLADVVVEHPGAYVLDLSALLSKAAEQRFAGDFLERLYRAKKRESGPLLVVVDEADVFAPQRPGPEQTRTLGALESIVRRGRIKGLGDLLITQRAAVLNKNVLTQTEILVVMQTTGPQDIAAVREWVSGHATKEQAEEFVASLASMERGEAWVWSPSFLRILQRVRIRARRTFDSSRTPEAGEASITPTTFAKVDLAKLGARIAATVERVKADDPRELRRRIAELERAAAKPGPNIPETIPDGRVDELEGQLRMLGEALRGSREDTDAAQRRIDDLRVGITNAAERLTTVVEDLEQLLRAQPAPVVRTPVATREQHGRSVRGPSRAETEVRALSPAPPRPPASAPTPALLNGEASLGKAERQILAALASYPTGLTREQLAFLAGYHQRSSGFVNAIGSLRSAGYISATYPATLTDAGRALEAVRYAPAIAGVIDLFTSRFGKAEKGILAELTASYPQPVGREDLAEKLGYHPRSSGFVNALGRLRGLGLVDGFALHPDFATLAGIA